jgi:diguanylate cyclase (GGDEF)-like protein
MEPPRDEAAASAVLTHARLTLHRVGMPVLAAFLATLFAVSVRDGFPDKVEAFGTPVLAVVALAAGAVAWRGSRPSRALEHTLLVGSLAVIAGGSLESALTLRFEIGYPYILGFLPLGYAGAFLVLGPVGGTVASLAAYLVVAAAALAAVASEEIHLARGLPILAGSPILIGLLYTLAWSLTNAAKAHVRAEAEAATDALTGALNRRSGEAALARLEGPFALLVVDMDDFKRVNDERGHAFGDDVLVRVTHAMRASVRPADLVVRWGGDEFVIVAPTADHEVAQQISERVRAGIESLHDRYARPITATIGVAVRQPGEAWRAALERADASMYAAKGARHDPASDPPDAATTRGRDEA